MPPIVREVVVAAAAVKVEAVHWIPEVHFSTHKMMGEVVVGAAAVKVEAVHWIPEVHFSTHKMMGSVGIRGTSEIVTSDTPGAAYIIDEYNEQAATTTSLTIGGICDSPEYAPPNKPDMVKKNLCTMVHVFGTNSWREILQVPSYPITGKAVFANGCLHWLVSHLDIKTEDGGREVIWFNVNKEEVGLIDPPKRMCHLWSMYRCYYDH
nr:F-box domain-containing protein [Tanacetum cinerariifolium]